MSLVSTKELVGLKEDVRIVGHRLAMEAQHTRDALDRARHAEDQCDRLAGELAARRAAETKIAPLPAAAWNSADLEEALDGALVLRWDISRRQAELFLPSVFFPGKADGRPIGGLALLPRRRGPGGTVGFTLWLRWGEGNKPAPLAALRWGEGNKPAPLAALARAVQLVIGPPKQAPYEQTLLEDGHGELVGQRATALFTRQDRRLSIEAWTDGPAAK